MTSSPAIGPDGTVYVGSSDGTLYALDGASGHRKWAFGTGGCVGTPAVSSNGSVYAISTGPDGSTVHVVDALSGRPRRTVSTDHLFLAPPAIGADGTLYTGSEDGQVLALDGISGGRKWVFEAHAAVRGAPAIGADGTVYVETGERQVSVHVLPGYLYALDGQTGRRKWAVPARAPLVPCPAIGPMGTVFAGSPDGQGIAGYSAAGTRTWVFRGSGVVEALNPTIGANGAVYAAYGNGSVYGVDGTTGKLRWRATAHGVGKSDPAVSADGALYVGSADGNVYALDGKTGRQRWAFATGAAVQSSPAIGADGTVYVATSAGTLLAIR